jgi:hypothetical protein
VVDVSLQSSCAGHIWPTEELRPHASYERSVSMHTKAKMLCCWEHARLLSQQAQSVTSGLTSFKLSATILSFLRTVATMAASMEVLSAEAT